MVKFFTSFTVDHVALLISVLAILASLYANSIAQQARKFSEEAHRQAERVRVFEKRTDILSEIDTQNARFGTLLAIIAEKMLLIQKSPALLQSHSREYERLSQNLTAIKNLHSRYEEQRGLTEQVGEGVDLAQQEEVLAEIRRMTIHLNETIKKEESQLEELKRLSKEAAQNPAL